MLLDDAQQFAVQARRAVSDMGCGKHWLVHWGYIFDQVKTPRRDHVAGRGFHHKA